MTRHTASAAGRPGTPRALRSRLRPGRGRIALAVVATLCAWAPAARGGPATEGLFLTWNDCRAGAPASSAATFDCAVNAGEHELVAGFRLVAPIDSVIGVEIVIDLQLAEPAFLPWWELQPGGCRENLLDASAEVAGTSCADPWGGNGTALVQDVQIGEPRGGANQARFKIVVAVAPSDSARSLAAGVDYTAVRFLLPHAKSTGPLSCAGCAAHACLVLNGMLFRVLPGGSGDVRVEAPAGAGAQQATWQGLTADCSAVPVRASTWGRLKSLYR